MVNQVCTIEQEIIASLNTYAKNVYGISSTNKSWTKDIKEILIQLGKGRKYKVCTGSCESADSGEWLYDLMWYQEDTQSRITDIPLIVESEWDRRFDWIKADFKKLIQGKAAHRLMICQAYQESIPTISKILIEQIESFKYSSTGDRFLIALYNSCKHEFEFILYIKQ